MHTLSLVRDQSCALLPFSKTCLVRQAGSKYPLVSALSTGPVLDFKDPDMLLLGPSFNITGLTCPWHYQSFTVWCNLIMIIFGHIESSHWPFIGPANPRESWFCTFKVLTITGYGTGQTQFMTLIRPDTPWTGPVLYIYSRVMPWKGLLSGL